MQDIQLPLFDFVKDGSRYRLDMYEQKTNKYRNFTVPNEVYQFVRDYAYAHNISSLVVKASFGLGRAFRILSAYAAGFLFSRSLATALLKI